MSSSIGDTAPPQPLGSLPALYTVAQAARWLGVAEKTVRRMISGDLAVVRINRQLRIPEQALAELLDQKSDASTL